MEIPEVMSVLAMLAQGVGAGFVLSFLAEKSAWFQGLDGEKKGWLVFGLSLGLPLLAQVLLAVVPPEMWAVVQPFWRAVAAGFVGWAGSQAAYLGIIKPVTRSKNAAPTE